ncbi:hypothetical protein C5S32_11740 [ANME-1 cluster archaeon GoMg1]|nr:hypothetical protein [ANME-1 cluster archaeon GoMg1]
MKSAKCKSQNKSFFKKSLLKLDTLRFIPNFLGHASEMIGGKIKKSESFFIVYDKYIGSLSHTHSYLSAGLVLKGGWG